MNDKRRQRESINKGKQARCKGWLERLVMWRVVAVQSRAATVNERPAPEAAKHNPARHTHGAHATSG